MNCPYCRSQIDNGSQVCPICKADLRNLYRNQTQQHMSEQNNQQFNNPMQQQIPQQNNQQFNNYDNKTNKSKTNKGLVIAIIIVVVIVLLILGAFLGVKSLINKFNNAANTFMNEMEDEVEISVVKNENGIPKFIDGRFTDINVKNETDAFEALNALKDQLNFKNVNEEFSIESAEESENITYYRFNQMYNGIEVYGNNVVISVDEEGNVLSFSGYYAPNINIENANEKSKEKIEELLKEHIGKDDAEIIESKKYIFNDDNTNLVVYIIDASSEEDLMEYMVDASTGDIINQTEVFDYAGYQFEGKGLEGITNVTIDEVNKIAPTDKGYRLIDPDRKIEIVDASMVGQDIIGLIITKRYSSQNPMEGEIDGNKFVYRDGEGENEKLAEAGISALKNFEEIYDYYYNVLGRKSYDNKGGKIIVNIGLKENTFKKGKLQNAMWFYETKQIYIGYDGEQSYAICKDVLAHEFTHAVVSKTSKFSRFVKSKDLNKANETGALNEGISDIMACLIEGNNWTISEKTNLMRNLENPAESEEKYPSVKGGDYYFPEGYMPEGKTIEDLIKANDGWTSINDYDNGGEHHNATVPGHAAYLMYKNGAFSSKEQMAKVWYNALFIMSSHSNFEDCALAVIKTAQNQGLSSSSVEIIRNAFRETKMLDDGINNEKQEESNITEDNSYDDEYNTTFKNYNIEINMHTKAAGFEINSISKGVIDELHQKEYLETETPTMGMTVTMTTYTDYAAGYTYTEVPFGGGWTKEKNNSGLIDLKAILDKLEKMENVSKISENAFRVKMTKDEINGFMGNADTSAINGEIYVDVYTENGYIKKLEYDFSNIVSGFEEFSATIKFDNYNTAGDVNIPQEVIASAK